MSVYFTQSGSLSRTHLSELKIEQRISKAIKYIVKKLVSRDIFFDPIKIYFAIMVLRELICFFASL